MQNFMPSSLVKFGHGAWGMGHGALGIGHWALGRDAINRVCTIVFVLLVLLVPLVLLVLLPFSPKLRRFAKRRTIIH